MGLDIAVSEFSGEVNDIYSRKMYHLYRNEIEQKMEEDADIRKARISRIPWDTTCDVKVEFNGDQILSIGDDVTHWEKDETRNQHIDTLITRAKQLCATAETLADFVGGISEENVSSSLPAANAAESSSAASSSEAQPTQTASAFFDTPKAPDPMENLRKQLSCAVCMDVVRPPLKWRSLSCGCMFCACCLEGATRCHLCRRTIRGEVDMPMVDRLSETVLAAMYPAFPFGCNQTGVHVCQFFPVSCRYCKGVFEAGSHRCHLEPCPAPDRDKKGWIHIASCLLVKICKLEEKVDTLKRKCMDHEKENKRLRASQTMSQ